MADDKVKIDIRRRRQEPAIYEKNSLYLISDIGEENFVLIVTDPEGNPKKIEAEDLSEYAKLTDLPETTTLQELLDTAPEDIGKLQTPLRLNEWADSKYALKNHTHIWGDITDRPTKLTEFQNDLGNYGDWITENFADTKYALRTSSITGEGSLEGGGDLTQDRTIDLKDETKTDIGLGVEANSWGDHKTEGYLKDSDLDGYATEDWVEGKGYITSYEDTTYTAGEGLDLVGNEFSLTQSVTDALEEAHTHPNKNILDSILQGDLDNWNEAYSKTHTHANKTILDGISSRDISDWDTAFTKSHDHINKSLLDAIGDTDIENWDEAYSNTHTHANKNVLDGIISSDISNWNNKIDEDFADAKYTLNTVEVRGTNGLTGGGTLTTNRNIELSTDTKTDISKGVAAHAYTLDDVASNGNSTSVKLTGDSVFSNTLGKDYAQMEDLWKAGFSIQFLSSEYKLVLRRKDDFIISEVDLSSLVSGDLEVSIDDTDPLDPEIVFKQNGVEVGRVPASSLLAGVVRSGELVGKEIHFKDRIGTVIINIDLSPVLDAKSDKVTKISAGTGLSGGGTLAADRTISFNTTWGDARYQGKLTAGTNVAISASNEISALDTKYTAGRGLTLNDKEFTLPVSITGSGSFVKSISQSSGGISVVLGTPPNTNTTYSNMSLSELNTGTVTTARSISAKILTDWGNGKFALSTRTISAGTGLTGGGDLTDNRTIDLSTATKSDIAKGVTAHGWGDFRDFGLGRKRMDLADITSEDIQYARIFRSVESGHVGSILSMPFDGFGSGRTNLLRIYNGKAYISASLVSEGTAPSWRELWHTGNFTPSNYYTKNESNDRFALRTRTISAGNGLTGGGNLTANRTIGLSTDTQEDIAKGVEAHGWGNHASAGYATEEFVGNAIDDIEIGGRNYLLGTSEEWRTATIISYNIYPFGGGSSSPTITDVEEGESYVFSARVRPYNQRARLHVRFFNETGSAVGNIYSEFIDSEDEGRLYLAFTVPENAVSFFIAIRREFNDNESTTVEYKKAKLEKGNKATDWTPAPEDQVTDWNETNPESYSFLKNKPTDLATQNWVNSQGFINDLSNYYTKSESNDTFALRTRTITGTGGLTGGGDLTANRTIGLSADTQEDIAKGVTAHGWGDFREFGLGSIGVSDSQIDNIDGNLFFRTGSINVFGNFGSGISLNRQFSDGGRIAQLHIATPPSGSEVSLKSRVRTGDGWSDVVELWHSGNLENPATEGWVEAQGYLQELVTNENVGGYLSLSNSNNLNLTSLSSRVRQNSLERYNTSSNIFTPYTTSAGSTGYPSSGGIGSGIRIERRSSNTNQTGFDIWARGATQSELYFKTFRGEDDEGSWNEFWHSGNLTDPATESWVNTQGFLKTAQAPLTNSTTNTISGTQVRRAALTGDVTAAQNSNETTIADKAVTLTKMADLTANSLIGRGSGTGVPQRLTLGNKLSISGTEINAEDTTYNAGTLALLNAGTNTENRVWGAKPISDFVKSEASVGILLYVFSSVYALAQDEEQPMKFTILQQDIGGIASVNSSNNNYITIEKEGVYEVTVRTNSNPGERVFKVYADGVRLPGTTMSFGSIQNDTLKSYYFEGNIGSNVVVLGKNESSSPRQLGGEVIIKKL